MERASKYEKQSTQNIISEAKPTIVIIKNKATEEAMHLRTHHQFINGWWLWGENTTSL